MAFVVDSRRLSLRAAVLTGTSFRACVLAATLLPLSVAIGLLILPTLRLTPSFVPVSLSTVFVWMGTLSSAHVFSTAYLLFNPSEFRGMRNSGTVLVAMPILLFFSTFLILLAAPLWMAMIFMLVYIHYGMWHLGGKTWACSFSSRAFLSSDR